MTKGILCYYSGSGNTRLACKYIVGRLTFPFDLLDVVQNSKVDLEPYGVVGFATFTDFLAPPYFYRAFIERLPRQKSRPAFVFNTYGSYSGQTLRILEKTVTAKGFVVIAGQSLHTPESYPPMIARGKGAEDMPDEEQMKDLDAFISDLGQRLEQVQKRQRVEGKRLRIGLLNSMLPALPRTTARRDMGHKFVDETLCTECGTCEKGCPYEAIRLEPKPVFDTSKCYGCWRCYNRCPMHAISTEKYSNGPYYPKPLDQLTEKLRIQT